MNRKTWIIALLLTSSVFVRAEPTSWQDEFPGLSVERMPERPAFPGTPEPLSKADRERDIRTLQSRIVGTDVSPQAVDTAARTVDKMLEQADPEVVHNLVQQQVWLFIIPRDRKLTDLPEFSSLRGTTTADGRLWDDVRGVGYLPISGGRIGVAFAEENLVDASNDPPKGYPALFLLAHEFSHSVQMAGLPSGIYQRSVQIYNEAVRREGGTGLGNYADSNAYENFAQAAAAYFGVGYLDSPRQVGEPARRRLIEKQPQMVELLSQVYGPMRDLWPMLESRGVDFFDPKISFIPFAFDRPITAEAVGSMGRYEGVGAIPTAR